ncbi:hypothetical protein Desca_1681 [Desulfotomaculum nigrificans CO-1-SRB]|uniref:Uncharacterized protein n=1 Tax=Desulfotomaculum nigrificans (strain DSM 14880 / VKM B-2319 / CO-1-SRB) TaxID=868595 RepID=F6B7H5_DESCC|nr:hypothetical protein [Desulfotomaculum nigrificans]AEF94529.1 hypothetical protein Desca_1681 [Desulfotomaculum nigrificans CO-1-SRB]
MALYLDIDLDYFVLPVIKESTSNRRPPDNLNCQIIDPGKLFNLLTQKGITLGPQRYIFTNHMQSHLRWWINGRRDNVILHIDAHSDLYGHNQQDLTNLKMLGCQNYLWHSVREGLVKEIYWVMPDNLMDISNPQIVKKMFSSEQLGRVNFADNILHVELICSLPGAQQKVIPYHMLYAENLPHFNETAEMVTIATSPEFYPRQADEIIKTVGKWLNFDQAKINKILQQHLEMEI